MKAGFSEKQIRAFVKMDPVKCRWPSDDAENPHEANGIMHRRQTERNRGQKSQFQPEGEVDHQNLSVLLELQDMQGKEPQPGDRFWLCLKEGWRMYRVTVCELSSDQSHFCVLLNEDAA